MRRDLLVRIAHILSKSSLEHVIGFIAGILAFPALKSSAKIECYSMHDFRGEAELVTVKLSVFEKLIEERAFVTLTVSIAGNVAGHRSAVFHGHLQELAIFEKAVHPGIDPAVFLTGRCRAFLGWRGSARAAGILGVKMRCWQGQNAN